MKTQLQLEIGNEMLEHLTIAVALMLLVTAQDPPQGFNALHTVFVVGAVVFALVHFFAAFVTLL